MSWLKDWLPETHEAFGQMRRAIYKEGALDVRVKELISVAVSTVVRCEPCIKIHAGRAKEAGATEDQIAEAISVAMFVAAGSQAHWSKALAEILGKKGES